MFKKTTKGFTLIELLVVIAIIGILATFAVISLSGARAASRNAKRVADIKQVQTAMELFFNDMGRYPTVDEFSTGSLYSTSTGNAVVYMSAVPSAPSPADGDCTANDNAYHYLVSADGSNYRIDFCTGGKVGSLTSGLNAATPVGMIQLAQGVFVDEAIEGLKVVAGTKDEKYGDALDSEIIAETNSIGAFRYPVSAEKIYFFADDEEKVRVGDIETKNIASDLVVSLPEAVLNRDKYGDDYKKLRSLTGQSEVIRMAKFINAISDESKTFSLGRKLNAQKLDILKKVVEKSGIGKYDENEVISKVPEWEKSQAFGVMYNDAETMKKLDMSGKNIAEGKHTPGKNGANAVDNNAGSNKCDDSTALCGFAKCGNSVTYQGLSYDTVQIGNQCWFKQNLNVGTMLEKFGLLPKNDSAVEKWCPAETSGGDVESSNMCNRLGALYTWPEALALPANCLNTYYGCGDRGCDSKDSACAFTYPRQGICPTGWHVPSRADFVSLASYIEPGVDFLATNKSNYGYLLKEAGTSNWGRENCGGATCNTTNFTALPSGRVYFNKNIWTNEGADMGLFLSSHIQDASMYIPLILGGKQVLTQEANSLKEVGVGVRCIKD